MIPGPLAGFGGLAFLIACGIIFVLVWILLLGQDVEQANADDDGETGADSHITLHCGNCPTVWREPIPTPLDVTRTVYCGPCAKDMAKVRGLAG